MSNGDMLVKPPIKRGTFLLIVVVMLVMYWTFIHFIEHIDMMVTLNASWHGRFPNARDLPHWLVTLVELLHPRVLRHFIPLITGWVIAYFAAVSLVRVLYDLPDNEFARRFLGRLITGQAAGDKPVMVSSRTLAAQRPEHVLLRVGGPGQLMVASGEVAVTEINGRYYRILPAGNNNLRPFEYVHSILSLRTQERQVTAVTLVTKDAIELTADFTITFHIDRGGTLPTRAQPYPFSPEAVERAAYAQINYGDQLTFNWLDIPVNTASGLLRAVVSKYTLDDLLYPRGNAREPHYIVTQELERKVRNSIDDSGIELESIRIGRLELPEKAKEQYIKHWQAGLDMQIRLTLAEGEANSLEEAEIVRAEAEVIMIQAIAEGLENARRAGSTGTMRDIIALRLVEALEKMARQSQSYEQLPLSLLPQIEHIRLQIDPKNQLSATSQDSEVET
ncbi:MAG: SPFH domain-containing protein [Anaerolineae bacterium]|nr:SPFH domain-containing protein [Anaerolineae bacterium]